MELFVTSSLVNVQQACCVVRGKLNLNQRNWCASPFSIQEVKDVLLEMNPQKAPRSDGLPTLFFQKYWHIVGRDVRSVILDVLNNGKDSSRIHDTHITLIPK